MTNCCSVVGKREFHCGQCHETFSCMTLFDAHQNVSYRRRRDDMVICRDPREMSLVQDDKGTWHTRDGLAFRRKNAARLARFREKGSA